jgi:hypothetical protein
MQILVELCFLNHNISAIVPHQWGTMKQMT